MEKIREYLEHIAPMSDKDWQIFSSKLTKRKVPKHTVLLKRGETENYMSFMETGIVRYYIPKDDNDVTFSFSFGNHFTSGYDSFLTRGPSPYQIETLTDVTLWRLTYNDLQHIYADTEVGQTMARHACEAIFLLKSKRELSLLNDTAEQRYLNLFTEEPYLIKYIPLKYIASYIGVTPQGLSRIRRRIT
ncbi:cAMP-binding domain of CRP or a regulatory subunit of cAMP-dependent protein kinases [Mucilaginibacter lappiensis]|uniref:CRP-like cAMP-binding protein n=1 Tax=Mucilaginibacter lappiensis TaxID=354630 RepID=A0ABR6PPK7_9SPHI|nr:Crp/Fnr family transcriptional regulator [Mucilaginibacter lappiensis]MBB6111523.1 CRP-like cAMP-binding protein [Mucilaginibacter lappiensis]SIR80771.1 cAMP-binding domain of CRP or a regulatory subunit of cAMP-dependent protein kinases [Mucilaginibacter lappiensis]